MKEINCGSYQKIADLKELLMTRMDGMEKLTDERFKSQNIAATKLEENLKEYKGQANEWRAQSKDQAATYSTKTEINLISEGLSARIKILEDSKIEKGGESGGAKNLWANIIGVLGVISLISALLLRFIKP